MRRTWFFVGVIVILLAFVALAVFTLRMTTQNPNADLPTVALLPTLIPTQPPTITPTATPTATSKPTDAPTLTPTTAQVPTDTATDTTTPTVADSAVSSAEVSTPNTPTSPDGLVAPVTGAIVRSGPGDEYDEIGKIPWNEDFTVLGRNSDGSWLKVQWRFLEGWSRNDGDALRLNIDVNDKTAVPVLAESGATVVPSATLPVVATVSPAPAITVTPNAAFTATITLTPTAETSKDCINVVGDSIAAGGSVFELPGVGFISAQLAPLSDALAKQLQANEDRVLAKYQVFDRSVGAVGLSVASETGKNPAYTTTEAYTSLLSDHCRFTVIAPWVNDLSSGLDANAAAPKHIAALDRLIGDIVTANPQATIIVYNYYIGAPAAFALNSFAPGFTASNIAGFNQALAAACATGPLKRPEVICADSSSAEAGLGSAYVFSAVSPAELTAQLAAPLKPDEANMLSYFAANNAGNGINGDGVHLDLAGKTAFASNILMIVRSKLN